MMTLVDVLEVVEEVEPTYRCGDGFMIYGHTVHIFIDKKRNPQWWIKEYPTSVERYRFGWGRHGGAVKILNQTNFFNKSYLKHYLESVKLHHILESL